MTAEAATEAPDRKKQLTRRIIQATVVVALIAAVLVFGVGKLPSWSDITEALGSANPTLVLAGLVATFGALVASARGQQLLARALNGTLTLTRSVLVASAGGTIATAVPLGGPLSVGFTVRWLAEGGMTAVTATTVAVLSGALSIVALCVMGLAGLTSIWAPWLWHHLGGALLVLLIVVAVAVIGYLIRRRTSGRGIGSRLVQWLATRTPQRIVDLVTRAADAVRPTVRDLRALRTRTLVRTTGVLALRWVFDIACLVFMADAVGLTLEPIDAVVAYLTVQVTRQITILPGGVGIVEVALASALIVQGAAAGPAAAAVLLYRLASQWLPMLVGIAPMVYLMRRSRAANAEAKREDDVPLPA